MQQSVQQRQPPLPQVQPGKMGWLERITYGSQHNVFRITAIVLSSWSALSVYTMFSGSAANPAIKQFMDVSSTIAFVALGYFVLRGWAHRMKEGKPVASYAVLSVLYAAYEVACNLSVFSGQNASTTWLVDMHTVLLSISAFVKSMMPIFAMSMARVEVDLMAERGTLSLVPPQVKQPPVPVPAIMRPGAPPVRPQPKPMSQNGPALAGSPQPQQWPTPAGQPSQQRPMQPQEQRRQPVANAATPSDRGRQQVRQDQGSATYQGQPTRAYGSKNALNGFYGEVSDEPLMQEQGAVP